MEELLESSNDRSNAAVITSYVSSRDDLRISMKLMGESSKSILCVALHVFKIVAANQPQSFSSPRQNMMHELYQNCITLAADNIT